MSEAIRRGDIPGVQLRCRQGLELPPGEAWRFLTEPEKLATWLCRQARAEGQTMEWSGARDLDGGPSETVRILETNPPRKLVAALSQADWPATTRLELELRPTDGGCELSVLQNGFEHLPLSISLTVWEAYRRRWRAAIERLGLQLGR